MPWYTVVHYYHVGSNSKLSAYLNNELETEVLYRHTDENEHTLKQ